METTRNKIVAVPEVGYPRSVVLYKGMSANNAFPIDTYELLGLLKAGDHDVHPDIIMEVEDCIRENCYNTVNAGLMEVKSMIEFIQKDLTEGFNPNMVKGLLESMQNIECECDPYHGFDCGCSARNAIIGDAIKAVEFIWNV